MAKRPVKPMHLTGTHSSIRQGYCAQGHPSIKGMPTPHTMTAIRLDNGAVELLHKQSLDIFTAMANDGHSFSDSLAAILLTGINWGSSARKETP